MRLSHGRFGRLEVIPLLHGAAGSTGPCEQGSSSHRLDRFLVTFYYGLVTFSCCPSLWCCSMDSGKRKNPPRGARPRSSDAGGRSADRAVRGRGTPSRSSGVAGASAGDEGIPAPLHTHTVPCPPPSHQLEFEAKLCLILCKRRADPWTPMSFVSASQ